MDKLRIDDTISYSKSDLKRIERIKKLAEELLQRNSHSEVCARCQDLRRIAYDLERLNGVTTTRYVPNWY